MAVVHLILIGANLIAFLYTGNPIALIGVAACGFMLLKSEE